MIYSAYSVYIGFPPHLSFMYLRSMRDRRAGMNRSSAEKQQRIAQQPDQLTVREGKGMVRDDERPKQTRRQAGARKKNHFLLPKGNTNNIASSRSSVKNLTATYEV